VLTRFFVQWLKLVNPNCKILNLLTRSLLTILKLVNVTAKCTFLFTKGDKLFLHFDFLPNMVHNILGGSFAWTAALAVSSGSVSCVCWLAGAWTLLELRLCKR
jgi:hypothetical protein